MPLTLNSSPQGSTGGLDIGIEGESLLTVQLHQRENLISFQKMLDTYGLGKMYFFSHLQTRSYFNDQIKPLEESETNLINIFIDMYKNKDNKKLVSKLYSCIQSNKKHSTDKVRLKWEKGSGSVITEEEWLNICSVQSTFRFLLAESG